MRKLFIFLVIIIIFAGGAFQSDAASEIPDLKNAEWLLLGPFSYTVTDEWYAQYHRDYLKELGGEINAKPVLSKKIAGKKWLKVKAIDGQINLGEVYGDQTYCVIYGFLEFYSKRSETVALKLGSDDGLKVWFNGKPLLTNSIIRSLRPNDEAVQVRIIPGINRLLLKVVQQKGAWGFAAQFRSLADETTEWCKTNFQGYRIYLNQYHSGNGPLNLLVATVPAFAVKEQVELTFANHQGESLKKMTVWTGEPVNMDLPSNFKGIGRISVRGTGLRADQEFETVVLVGDPKLIIQENVKLARQTALKKPYGDKGEDLAATLTFLADQLEGKIYPSLSDSKRNLRAIQLIGELTQTAKNPSQIIGSKSGVRQWAYRSAIDGSCQPYTVYIPDGYSTKRKYALLVNLHGYSGDDYSPVTKLVQDYHPEDFIVVAPFGRGDIQYGSIGEQDVLDVIDLMERTYSIDPDRIYLMGSSMGGCGAWRIGQFYPDRFAAVAPFCGWTDTKYLTNLRNLPVFVVHGADDPTVPVDYSQNAAACLENLGYQTRYDELPGVGHNALDAWIVKNGVSNFFKYLRSFKRNPWPERLTINVPYLRFGRHYWVRVEEPANRNQTCQLSARVVDERHLVIDTTNVTAFSLNLRHPKLAQAGRIVIDINGYYVTVNAGLEDVLLTFSESRGRFISVTRPSSIKARHEGGGLADLFCGPLYIVYGTKGRPKVLQEAAELLADWTISDYRPTGIKVGRFRVIADRDVTDQILKSSNLLCIGSAFENSLSSRLSGKLPLRFTKDSVELAGKNYKKTGFTLVYYNPYAPTRLVGIISLPFKDRDLIRFIRNLNLKMCASVQANGVDTFTTPDVMIFGAIDRLIWKGSFNLFWKELRAK